MRHERVYAQDKTPWTKAHRGWLADRRFDLPVHQLVLEEGIEAARLAEQRRDRVEAHPRAAIPAWSLADLVRNLSALRGLDTIGAAGLTAAIGDATRFATAGAFIAYLGRVPSEHSPGAKRRQGGITKSGDIHARTVLIEAAWSDRFPARIARAKLAAVEAVPEPVREIAWKAQTRLCRRYREMILAGKPKQVVVTAIARELGGCLGYRPCHRGAAGGGGGREPGGIPGRLPRGHGRGSGRPPRCEEKRESDGMRPKIHPYGQACGAARRSRAWRCGRPPSRTPRAASGGGLAEQRGHPPPSRGQALDRGRPHHQGKIRPGRENGAPTEPENDCGGSGPAKTSRVPKSGQSPAPPA